MPGPEHTPHPERSSETLKDFERAPEILNKTEHSPEESPEEVEKHIEHARTEAQREARAAHETSATEEKNVGRELARPHMTREQSYMHTMKTVRMELSAPERAFSKIIHNPVVEQVSDTVGKTIARPHAILSGSLFACIFVLTLYLIARFYGFELRGSETILAFLIGWALGIVFDIVRSAIKRRH